MSVGKVLGVSWLAGAEQRTGFIKKGNRLTFTGEELRRMMELAGADYDIRPPFDGTAVSSKPANCSQPLDFHFSMVVIE